MPPQRLVGSDKTSVSQGQARPRNVVARFPSVEAAEECYHSEAYQRALNHAREASERELLIVETSE